MLCLEWGGCANVLPAARYWGLSLEYPTLWLGEAFLLLGWPDLHRAEMFSRTDDASSWKVQLFLGGKDM